METRAQRYKVVPRILSTLLLLGLLLAWHAATGKPKFDATGLTEDDIMLLEMNGDIIPDAENEGTYITNPDKTTTFPGPLDVGAKIVEEFSEPFHKKGTNDHGIGWLIIYTLIVFAMGFVAASIFGVVLGVLIGLSRTLFDVLNPFLQVLKPISPLAWMPLLLYTVQDGKTTSVLVVFMAALWPTVANTAFGVNNIRQDYLRVASLLQFGWVRRLFTVILPGAAPAIISGLRISFGSALVAVVPAEMLLGELGVGYNTWIEWNNLDISGVIFTILVIGVLGFILDSLFDRIAKGVSFAEYTNPESGKRSMAMQVDCVTKNFPILTGNGGSTNDEFCVFEDVDFDIYEGEYISMVGHSGCGKSTLLNIMAGFDRPSRGGIIVDGSEVVGPGLDRMVVFQSFALMPWLTAFDNVRVAAKSAYPTWSKAQIDQHTQKYINTMGLAGAERKRPALLSGGMRQRVGIARAFCVDPKVLLLDEPFAQIDALTRGVIQDELMRMWEATNATVFMVTHDVDEAILLSDRIALMTNGPNARLAEIIEVNVPRPRTREQLIEHPEYTRVRNHILHFLISHQNVEICGSANVLRSGNRRIEKQSHR